MSKYYLDETVISKTKEPRGWLVWMATAIMWILALALWTGIFTILGLGIAEHYQYPIVPELAMHQYESRK